jgi:hypothetical protein
MIRSLAPNGKSARTRTKRIRGFEAVRPWAHGLKPPSGDVPHSAIYRSVLVVCATAIAFALPAAADKIVLKSGATYEGRLVGETDKELSLEILVSGKPLKITVARDAIASFDRMPSVFDRYEEKASKVDRKDADALVELAGWCRDQHLVERSAKHLLEALALQPDHAVAARMIESMGYVKEGTAWMPEAEQKRALGLEKWGDEWLPKDEVAKRRAERDARWRAEQEQARRQRELEGAEQSLVRASRDGEKLEANLIETNKNLVDCETRLQRLAKERAEAEKKRSEAASRRDRSRGEMRSNNDPNRSGDVARQYSQARKDLQAAERELARVQGEIDRAARNRKGLAQDRDELERKLKDKQAEWDRAAGRKDAILNPASR